MLLKIVYKNEQLDDSVNRPFSSTIINKAAYKQNTLQIRQITKNCNVIVVTVYIVYSVYCILRRIYERRTALWILFGIF